jgi:hypothetical protein
MRLKEYDAREVSVSEKEPELTRTCPRCKAAVQGTLLEGDDGVTWLWRCSCGWAGARTESGVVSRAQVRQLIERADNKTGP